MTNLSCASQRAASTTETRATSDDAQPRSNGSTLDDRHHHRARARAHATLMGAHQNRAGHDRAVETVSAHVDALARKLRPQTSFMRLAKTRARAPITNTKQSDARQSALICPKGSSTRANISIVSADVSGARARPHTHTQALINLIAMAAAALDVRVLCVRGPSTRTRNRDLYARARTHYERHLGNHQVNIDASSRLVV